MKRLIFFSLFVVSLPAVYCQQTEYIRGKVTDSKTSQAVPYATVRLKNSQVGIISNAEGDFRILNNPVFQADSLIVSCIGYHRLSLAFRNLKPTRMYNLKLMPYTYSLKEISVTARKKRLSPEIIIGRALNNIKKNYPVSPFNHISYYRDYLKDSVNYLNLNEAIIQTLDNGFSNASDSNKYRLLDFKKNMDFLRKDITPYYDLPETDHSDVSFKRIPNAMIGDQYGNELFILLVHDAIRNYDKRSFSFIDTLTRNFIKNHWFSTPLGVYEGTNLLYKIDFNSRGQILGDNIKTKGAIFIQPDDYSIHKLEYSASYSDSGGKNKEVFSIETEYGREPALDNKMFLKYISFSNSFIIPDTSDNDYFKSEKIEWSQIGGPYACMPPYNMDITANFNRKIDPVLGEKKDNYILTIGKRIAKIKRVMVDRSHLIISLRDDHFKSNEIDSVYLHIKFLKDIDGNILNKRKGLEFRQFRELFVQEYNKPLKIQDTCFIKAIPLEQNCISTSDKAGRFWMNTPLKAEEKGNSEQ